MTDLEQDLINRCIAYYRRCKKTRNLPGCNPPKLVKDIWYLVDQILKQRNKVDG